MNQTHGQELNTDLTLHGYYLFRIVKLTNNVHSDKYGYNGYVIASGLSTQFSLSNSEWGKNVVIFGVDNGSSMHAGNKKNILVLGEG